MPAHKKSLFTTRSGALGTLLVLVLVIVYPFARSWRWDSFPVSSYPMFSRGDVGSDVSLQQALMVSPDGSRRPVSPTLVGSPEPMVAMRLVHLAVVRGTADELCRQIAARVGGTRGDTRNDAVEVEIASSTFDARHYFTVSREPIRRTIAARCPVDGGQAP